MGEAARDALLSELSETNGAFCAEGAGGVAEDGAAALYSDADAARSAPESRRWEEDARRPEDAIPDKPENEAVRDFLKNAPSKGLWMPMGVEVKVMQCWRCKAYGHRTGDRECPLNAAGNVVLDAERHAREDPMAAQIAERKRDDDDAAATGAVTALEALVSDIREERERKKRKKEKRKKEKKKKEKKKRKRAASSSSSSSPSGSGSSGD